MAEPSFMNDLGQSIQDRYAEIKGALQAAPGRVAHAVQPVTDRLSLLANDPGEFARTGFQALKQQMQPEIAAAGTGAVLSTGAATADPMARPGVPEEALSGELVAVPEEQRQQAIAQAIQQRVLRRAQGLPD